MTKGNEAVYRLCLVRIVGEFHPDSWDAWPEFCTIMQAGRRLYCREYAEGYAVARNQRLRAAGRNAYVVVMRPDQRARPGELCERGVPLYDCA